MNDFDAHRNAWTGNQELAEAMIPHIGALHRGRDVVTSIHGHRLAGLGATGIIALHEKATELGHAKLELADSLAVLQILTAIEPGPASIDIARAQAKAAQRSAIVGAVMIAIGLGIGIVLISSETSRISLFPLFFVVAGLVQLIRGVRTRSAALAQVRAMGGEYGVTQTSIPGALGSGSYERPGGVSTTDNPPPGVTPPGGDPLKW